MDASRFTRRQAMALISAGGALAWQPPDVPGAIIRRHEAALEDLLNRQVTDPRSPWLGGCPDRWELHEPGSAMALVELGVAGLLHPQSRFHDNDELTSRVALAAGFLERAQNERGALDLLITNFDSTPDTGFVVHGVASACLLARRAGRPDLVASLEPFLRRAGGALAGGGVHTPNHRWVVCSALAQIHELFPEQRYLGRIGQWLAEGIDIDEDGQYTERSTLAYNIVCNRSLIVLAEKLKRPELLDPVRRNLEAMLYLLHPGDELVTEISRRQDQYQRGSAGKHWFALKFIGIRDADGRFNGLANRHAERFARLSSLMEYPQLSLPGPPPAAIPDHYERMMPATGIARIRRGPVSATVVLRGDSRFFTFRQGEMIVRAIRFASAFFGKGQFVPGEAEKVGDRYVLRQSLSAPYYQPLDPPRRVEPRDWERTRNERPRSEIQTLDCEAAIRERKGGFDVTIKGSGTGKVPLAIEINLDGDGEVTGVTPAPAGDGALLMAGDFVTWRRGPAALRFGPRLREHAYTRVRGADDKLPGRSVFLTAYTPVDHTIEFRFR